MEVRVISDQRLPTDRRRKSGIAVPLILLSFLVMLPRNTIAAVEEDKPGTCSMPDAQLGGPDNGLSGVPYLLGSSKQSRSTNRAAVRRIEYQTVTVQSLAEAGEFYGGVLGGHEVRFCAEQGTERGAKQKDYCTPEGFVRIRGDEHFKAMFGADSLPEEIKLPDIRDKGEAELLSRFFLFGNGLVQLLEFTGGSGLCEPRTSPVWMSAAHIDFWIEDDVDANEYISDVETRSAARGLTSVAFNRPVAMEKPEDRAKVPMESYANVVPENDGPFGGLSWAYYKGPSGEQLEIYRTLGNMRAGLGAAWCRRGAVSPAFVARERNNEDKRPLSAKMHGIFQYGFRTADLHRSTAFYAEVLGGDLVTYPTQGVAIMQSDESHYMILGNETLEARALAAREGMPLADAMRKLGVANLTADGQQRLDHRFILFDNFVVEPLEYTDGLSFGGDGFDPKLEHGSSQAYIGTVAAAFGTPPDVGLSQYLHSLQSRAERQGVRGLRTPAELAGFPADHPFHGLEYGYGKGPDGEAIVFSRISGAFQETLHLALLASGHLSTMFDDTNPFLDGRMGPFCRGVGIDAPDPDTASTH